MSIKNIEYWENYRTGILSHLHTRKKGVCYPKVSRNVNDIGCVEVITPINENDLHRLRKELSRINLIINVLKSIKKQK